MEVTKNKNRNAFYLLVFLLFLTSISLVNADVDWQFNDVTSSRSLDNVYQNNATQTFLIVTLNLTSTTANFSEVIFRSDVNSAPSTDLLFLRNGNGTYKTDRYVLSAIVKPNHYYSLVNNSQGGASAVVVKWIEYKVVEPNTTEENYLYMYLALFILGLLLFILSLYLEDSYIMVASGIPFIILSISLIRFGYPNFSNTLVMTGLWGTFLVVGSYLMIRGGIESFGAK